MERLRITKKERIGKDDNVLDNIDINNVRANIENVKSQIAHSNSFAEKILYEGMLFNLTQILKIKENK